MCYLALSPQTVATAFSILGDNETAHTFIRFMDAYFASCDSAPPPPLWQTPMPREETKQLEKVVKLTAELINALDGLEERPRARMMENGANFKAINIFLLELYSDAANPINGTPQTTKGHNKITAGQIYDLRVIDNYYRRHYPGSHPTIRERSKYRRIIELFTGIEDARHVIKTYLKTPS